MMYETAKKDHDFFRTLCSIGDDPSLPHKQRETRGAAGGSVDRLKFLRNAYEEISAGVTAPIDIAFAVEGFCRRYFMHGHTSRKDAKGTWILDPVSNFHAQFLQCSEVNRLLLDILCVGGFEGRIVILSMHQAAEVLIDGRWIYLDADLIGFAQRPLNGSGEPATIAEIYADPTIADRLIANSENQFARQIVGESFGATWYPGYVFRELSDPLPGRPAIPSVRWRSGALNDWAKLPDFGWRNQQGEDHEALSNGELPPWPKRRRSLVPRWTSIELDCGVLRLGWELPSGPREDGLSFRLDVSENSRNWCYARWRCDEALRKWWTFYGRPADHDYGKIDFLPNDDLGWYRTCQRSIEIELRSLPPQQVYLALVAEDDYGRSIGNERYMPSEEICIDLRTAQATGR